MTKYKLCVFAATLCGVTTWILWKWRKISNFFREQKSQDRSEKVSLSTEFSSSYGSTHPKSKVNPIPSISTDILTTEPKKISSPPVSEGFLSFATSFDDQQKQTNEEQTQTQPQNPIIVTEPETTTNTTTITISKPSKKPKKPLPSFKTNLEEIHDEYGGIPADEAERLRKVEYEERQLSKIREHIFLGSHFTTTNRVTLKEHGITHILNTASTVCPNYFLNDNTLNYLSFPLCDGVNEDILCCLYDAIEFMDNVVENKGNVLVHCWQGVSRSTTIVVAWWMLHEGVSFDEALQSIRKSRSIARPNYGFMYQLLEWGNRIKEGVASEPILYTLSLHVQSDSSRLVVKRIKPITKNSLIEDTCIILHTCKYLFLWIGSKCKSDHLQMARTHINRLQKYEHAPNLTEINQSEEDSLFLSFFQ